MAHGLADAAVEEGPGVQLEPGHLRLGARAAARRDEHEVEGLQRPDHGERQRDAELVAQGRQRDGEELADPARAVDPCRVVQGAVDLLDPGDEQHHAQADAEPGADHADRRATPR